jgi:hypothetical protein
MSLEVRSIRLKNSGDDEGALLMDGDRLVALLCRLGPLHDAAAGRWFVEWSSAPAGRSIGDFPDIATATRAVEDWTAAGRS